MSNCDHTIGFVLTAGGARGAYQAGVLKALMEIVTPDKTHRFCPILTGVSAGAINATYLAAHAADFREAAANLATIWSTIKTQNVFKTDLKTLSATGFWWTQNLLLGGLTKKRRARALLDTAPLLKYLKEIIPFGQIKTNLEQNRLKAVAISATDYDSGNLVTFVHGMEQMCWKSSQHYAFPVKMTVDHVMASGAIPIFFPPQRIGNSYYGDGAMRNTTPLSAAIRLGASKLFVIGVRRPRSQGKARGLYPSLGRIISILLNDIFLDAVDIDLEQLKRYNQLLSEIPGPPEGRKTFIKNIEAFYIHPSADVGQIALDSQKRLPRIIRYLIEGLGSPEEASELISYLFFESCYCKKLVELGYQDTLNRREAIALFLEKTPD